MTFGDSKVIDPVLGYKFSDINPLYYTPLYFNTAESNEKNYNFFLNRINQILEKTQINFISSARAFNCDRQKTHHGRAISTIVNVRLNSE